MDYTMFNPSFHKFRRKRIKPAKVADTTKLVCNRSNPRTVSEEEEDGKKRCRMTSQKVASTSKSFEECLSNFVCKKQDSSHLESASEECDMESDELASSSQSSLQSYLEDRLSQFVFKKQLGSHSPKLSSSNESELQSDKVASSQISDGEQPSELLSKKKDAQLPGGSKEHESTFGYELSNKRNKGVKKSSSPGKEIKYTPFEQQVMELKKKYPGMILMIQSGYKYFFYGEDAEVASKVLGIGAFSFNNFVRSSVPIERLHVHANTLIAAGHKVGVVKQQEVAELKAIGENKNKVFDRDLTAVYSRATAIGEEIDPFEKSLYKGSEESSARFILSVSEMQESSSKLKIGIVAFDVGTGEAYYDEFEDGSRRVELDKRLEHLHPAEILISEKISKISKIVLEHRRVRLEVMSSDKFNHSPSLLTVATFLSSSESTSDGITKLSPPIICALGGLLNYLKEINISETLKPENLKPFTSCEMYLQLDAATLRNLEIFRTYDGSHKHSLAWLFDQHSHPLFGARVLREWLSHPLRDLETLRKRQDAVTELLSVSQKGMGDLQSILHKMPDLEHGLTAVLLGRSSPSTLFSILKHLQCLKVRLQNIISGSEVCFSSRLLNHLISESALLLTNVPQFLANVNEEAARKRDVTQFLNDYSKYPAVVQLQKEIKDTSEQLDALLPHLANVIGLPSVKYTTVHGIEYLIEVKVKQDVPLSWNKVSGTKQFYRYHPPETMRLRNDLTILRAKLKQECVEAWKDFLKQFNQFYSSHKRAVKNVSTLDALIALAQLARTPGYCKPDLIEEDIVVNIQKGFHPIVFQASDAQFIPNDTLLESPENICMVLSGPNMGGKSCYIRQIALITIMAHIGSYVPAESATIGMLDAVYTRIGARDEIFEGRSTLMLEMEECAAIMHKATRRSLVLIDELGRGTSTFDGTAIAISTLIYFLEEIQCLTLFVTHFPEVLDVAPHYNFHMGFSKYHLDGLEKIAFLYIICPGKADKSYGLNVALLGGISKRIFEKASEKAKYLQETAEARRKKRKAFLGVYNATSIEEVRNALQEL